jgi:hypothetical protein
MIKITLSLLVGIFGSFVYFFLNWFTGYDKFSSGAEKKTLSELADALIHSPVHTFLPTIIIGLITGLVFYYSVAKKISN